MGFWQRMRALFQVRGGSTTRRYLDIYILNYRCNEPLASRIDLYNDLSPAEEGNAAFFVRKVLTTSGAGRCFSANEIQLWLDRNRKVVNMEVEGGKWLTYEEYQEELEAFQQRIQPT